MNYIGSKLSLLPFLEESIFKVAGNDNDKVFCDLFAGTGAVGIHFKKLGYRIIANDIQYYSYVLNRHYIGNHKELKFDGLNEEIKELKSSKNHIKTVIGYLNSLEPLQGFIYRHYCHNEHCDRQYFTAENGALCDAIRTKIEIWQTENKITADEYYYLLCSLLENIDKYANTASVYGAYLKHYKKSALKTFALTELPILVNEKEHAIYNEDSNKLIIDIESDILYLDPPYNTRQYSSNYHLLETIAKYDEPKIEGKTGLRKNKTNSAYCSKQSVKREFEDLINNAKTKYIFLSYNNEGLLTLSDIKEIMSHKGEYGFFTKEYNRFKADSSRDYRASKTVEYLHYSIVK
jgi:adenine-specific DNA-methyltransferase